MSKIELRVTDETFAGKILNELFLSMDTELVNVQEIIKARVYNEVDKYNRLLPEYYNGLVQPAEAEVTLNGYKLKEKRKIDPEKQFYIACDAFLKNSFFMLIGNTQATTLEEEVLLTKNSTISFVKLTPLVGG